MKTSQLTWKGKRKKLDLERGMCSGRRRQPFSPQNPLWLHHTVSPCCQLGLYSLPMLRLLLSHFLRCFLSPFPEVGLPIPPKVAAQQVSLMFLELNIREGSETDPHTPRQQGPGLSVSMKVIMPRDRTGGPLWGNRTASPCDLWLTSREKEPK